MSVMRDGKAADAQMSVDTQLRAIWTELLGVTQVADSDNFVELGGDSIAATQCVTRVLVELGVEVSVTALLVDDATFGSLLVEIEHAPEAAT